MSESKVLDILKSAIILEKKGESFYREVATRAEDISVKEFFEEMALEEKDHAKMLEDQFRYFSKTGLFNVEISKEYANNAESHVLDQDLKDKIESAGFEAAAISAALDMEKRAIKLYKNRSEEATEPSEKEVYKWLANWEQSHLDYLEELDRELTEKVWYDNSFWPM